MQKLKHNPTLALQTAHTLPSIELKTLWTTLKVPQWVIAMEEVLKALQQNHT